MTTRRQDWVLHAVIPAALLLVPVGGAWIEALAYVGCLLLLPNVSFVVVLLVKVGARLDVGRSVAPVCVGLVFAVASLIATARLAMGTPPWVIRKAAPAIVAIDRWRASSGTLPELERGEGAPQIVEALKVARCSYSRDRGGSGYTLLCAGLLFTSCFYDSETRLWGASMM